MKLTRTAFVHQMVSHLQRQTGETHRTDYKLARSVLSDFLHDEGIDYGDPNYDWDYKAARSIMDTEMEHYDEA